MSSALWKIGERVLDLSGKPIVMGVLNVTPDSFSDGGEFLQTDKAIERGLEMCSEGAVIIDVGGESTRPGAEPVSAEEEMARVIPVISRLAGAVEILISIDTAKANVARAALEAGAAIVNDVTGGRGDPKMMSVVQERAAGFIIMHMKGAPQTMQTNPRYGDVVAEVADFFRQQYACAIQCGIDAMAIAFDPGIGFGKTAAHNFELLANLPRLRVADRPIVLGLSRKSFLAKTIGSSRTRDRVAATVGLTSMLRERGADVFRVHDVSENVAALRITEALMEAEK